MQLAVVHYFGNLGLFASTQLPMFTITLLIVPFMGLEIFTTDWIFSLVSEAVLIPISSNCFCKLAFRAFKVFSSASADCKFFNAPSYGIISNVNERLGVLQREIAREIHAKAGIAAPPPANPIR